MESTRTKAEMMRPVLIKAGIPLAVTVAAFIFSKLGSRRNSVSSKGLKSENKVNPHQVSRDDEESFHSPIDSLSLPSLEDEEQIILTGTHFTNSSTSLLIDDRIHLEEEILGLRTRIEELQAREWMLETRFLQYCNMKEKESELVEIGNKLSLEMVRVEFLNKEVSSMEAESQRFEELVVEYLRILEELELARLENRLLRGKVKKLSRRIKGLSLVIREQNAKIEAREEQSLRNGEELERKSGVLKAMEDEITELQAAVDQLRLEKRETSKKLELTENSASSKIQEGITSEEYNKLVNELEQVQRDRAVEVTELAFLRWCNACLRHELARRNQEQAEERQSQCQPELDCGGGSGEIGHFGSENYDPLDESAVLGHHGESSSSLGVAAMVLKDSNDRCNDNDGGRQTHSKRPKLIQKLKRWVVEGSEKRRLKLDEREKDEANCFRRGLASDGQAEDELLLHPSRSCSSA